MPNELVFCAIFLLSFTICKFPMKLLVSNHLILVPSELNVGPSKSGDSSYSDEHIVYIVTEWSLWRLLCSNYGCRFILSIYVAFVT